MKKVFFAIIVFAFIGCKVTFITGYDAIIDETATKMQHDFNLFFIKLSRTICDNDPNNQNITNFYDYYDNMEADLITLRNRSASLSGKSAIVKKEIANIDSVMHQFKALHKAGFKDVDCSKPVYDDKRDLSNAVNSSINALMKLQEQLKSSGKISSK